MDLGSCGKVRDTDDYCFSEIPMARHDQPERQHQLDDSMAVKQFADLARRTAEVADSARRFLAAINTGGIGVTFAIAGALTSEKVPPKWAVWPVGVFSIGLALTAFSWQLQKYKTKKRRDAARVIVTSRKSVVNGEYEPVFRSSFWRNQSYDALALVAFVVGVFLGLYELSQITIP